MTNPEQIERDIERTRLEMDETLEQVEERINPRHLLDEVVDWFRADGAQNGTSEKLKKLGKTAACQVKAHPVPALLIGAGLAWLAYESAEEDGQDGVPGNWRNLPEYSGSYVDAATGEPYPSRYAGSAAWEEGYDWTGEEEASWQERARQSMEHIQSVFADTGKSAREKLSETAGHLRGLRGDKYEKNRGNWRDLPEHSGSFVDARTGEPYSSDYGSYCHPAEDFDFLTNHEWSEQDEETWSEKAQHAIDSMRETVSHGGHSVQRRVQSLASQLSSFAGTMQGRTSKAGGKLRGGAHRVGEKAGNLAHQAGNLAHQAKDQTGRLARGAQHRATEAVDEYPLAVGAACLGLGLVVGLAIPPTRKEDRLFGDASDELKDKAEETAMEAYERGKEVVRETGKAAMDEAERQGLTPKEIGERLKEGASHVADTARQEARGSGDLREKAERVADEAAETAKSRSKQEAESFSS